MHVRVFSVVFSAVIRGISVEPRRCSRVIGRRARGHGLPVELVRGVALLLLLVLLLEASLTRFWCWVLVFRAHCGSFSCSGPWAAHALRHQEPAESDAEHADGVDDVGEQGRRGHSRGGQERDQEGHDGQGQVGDNDPGHHRREDRQS